MEILNTVYWVVVYGVIPGIMLAMLGLGFYIAQRAPEEFRVSARAGLCAGLVAFAIYVVSSFSDFQPPEFTNKLPAFAWIPSTIGAIVGFLVLELVQRFKLSAGLLGLSVLFLVANSSTAIFSYFFASPLRNVVIFLALSALFGMLLHVVLFPAPMISMLQQGGEGGDEWIPPTA